MVRESDYHIGDISNDLTGFWTEEGYEEEGDNLTSPISKMVRVSKFRRDDSVIALVRIFGRELVERADGIIINRIEMLPIVRNDFRVETTGILEPDDTVNVELVIDGQIYSDKIPIVDVEFETFLKGEYKTRNDAKGRRLIVDTNKSVRLGIRNPSKTNPTEFWNRVYRTLSSNVINEVIERLSIDEKFFIDDTVKFTWEIMDNEGDFPSDSKELRESL